MFPTDLAIVGNGSSLLDQRQGQLIDQHEFVLRFNYCLINEEFAPYVGTKWTHWSTSFVAHNPILEGKNPPQLECVYWIAPVDAILQRNGLIAKYREITQRIPREFVYELVQNGPQGYSPTSGIRILWWYYRVMGHKFHRSHVYGFDHFRDRGTMSGVHYWDSGRTNPPPVHKPNYERELFLRITQ